MSQGVGRDGPGGAVAEAALRVPPCGSDAGDDDVGVVAGILESPSVLAMLEAMEREVALGRIGACGMLAQLADVLAANIIRAWVECGCSDSTGWIAAVQCPKVGKVIAAIHAEPQLDCGVPTLARLMGTSRSRFAKVFTRIVGESPARYVAKVKMFQARRWIQQEGMRVTVAAEKLGYASEASFSRVFKRIMGMPPSAVRSQAGGFAAEKAHVWFGRNAGVVEWLRASSGKAPPEAGRAIHVWKA